MTRRRALQAVSAVIVIAAGVFFLAGYTEPQAEVLDHHNYRVAIEGMRSGQGYYAAYDVGFREVYGPIPAARDIRFPGLYVALSYLPSGSEHVAYALMALAGGLVTIAMAKFPPSGILVTFYLLTLAVADNEAAQFLYAELWVVPLVIATVYALDRGNHTAALLMATLTFALREQGILLLGGIAVYLWMKRRLRTQAAAFVAVAVAGYLLHIRAVQPYLDPENGIHTPLHLGWEPLDSLLRTIGFGLGLEWLGPLLLAGAFAWAYRHRLLPAVGPFLAMPFLTVWANRPYWGVMVVPLAVVLSIDLIWELVIERDRVPQAEATSRLPPPL